MSASQWKLLKLRRISGQIQVVTGLRIGASQDTMEISGLDNPIIRNPADGMPYLPGSSIKGKMRSLAEWYYRELPGDGNPIYAAPDSRTARVFGVSAQKDREIGPTRIIVRDAFLTSDWRKKFLDGEPITEVKQENSINRLTAMANPRPMERIVPGVTFAFEVLYRILDADGDGGATDENNFNDVVLVALALLQADCLGSAGSRGCGQILFQNLKDENGAVVQLPNPFAEARAG